MIIDRGDWGRRPVLLDGIVESGDSQGLLNLLNIDEFDDCGGAFLVIRAIIPNALIKSLPAHERARAACTGQRTLVVKLSDASIHSVLS